MDDKKMYEQKLQTHLDEWNARFDVLAARMRRAGLEGKEKVEDGMENLRGKRDEARRAFQRLKTSGEHAWEKARLEAEQAFDSLSEHWKTLQERIG